MEIIIMFIVGLTTATILSSLLELMPFNQAMCGGLLASLVIDVLKRIR